MYAGTDCWNVLVSPNGTTQIAMSDDLVTVFHGQQRTPIKISGLSPAGQFLDDSTVLLSLGDEGKLAILDLKTGAIGATIALSEKNGYVVDLAVNRATKTAYALDVAHEKVHVIDLQSMKDVAQVDAGREPYAISLSEDGDSFYVANIGLFDYKLIRGKGDFGPSVLKLKKPDGISHPAFPFPSKEAEEGGKFEGLTVPGLGPDNGVSSHSLWKYKLANPVSPVPVAKVKCGVMIHAVDSNGEAVGGSAPDAVLATRNRVYVSNSNNDSVQEYRADDLSLLRTFHLNPVAALANYRGIIPCGLAASMDGKYLYVAEAGLNAVARIDLKSGRLAGAIPTGWFPIQIRLAPDDSQLYVSTQKGLGWGPRGPLQPRPKTDERYGLDPNPGMVERIDLNESTNWETGQKQVLTNDGLVAQAKLAPSFPKEITHVVFITKENHTFDGIFGAMKGVHGEPRYAEFGDQGWVREKGTSPRHSIMPNHLKLAEEFGISDNFYMEPHYSGDGHRWLVGVYPSLWTTRLYYSGWDFRADESTPGRLVAFGSNGSQIPEDYLENGSIWEHLDRGGITLRNFGEAFEFPGVDEGGPYSRTGAVEVANYPMPAAVFKNTCFEYPIFNTNIPDIDRVAWFEEDLKKNYRDHSKPLPRFMDITLCNDHGSSARPSFGYPYLSSFMADNDLALGKLVTYLSHTPEWKHMAIFVTEDDSGGDNDHIDRHRSYVMAIGPYCKRHYVSHVHGSIMSIIRSTYMIFGLGPNNLFDATAAPLADMFTSTPNFTPYNFIESDPEVFRPELTLAPDDPTFTRFRKDRFTDMPEGVSMDDPDFVEALHRGFELPKKGSQK